MGKKNKTNDKAKAPAAAKTAKNGDEQKENGIPAKNDQSAEIAPDPPIEGFENLAVNKANGSDPLLSSKDSPLYNIDPNSFKGLQSTYDRVRLFDTPFATVVMNDKVNKYCSHCMRLPETGKELLHCGACAFSRYCDKDCQKLAWKVHKHECRRLNGVFPNLPMTEVLFLSRITDKVIFLEDNGDKFGWEKPRKWSELMDHMEDIRADTPKMEHFEKIYTKICNFRKEEMVPKEKFFEIFCKVSINSHSIHTNAGDEIGMALDLGISIYDHSCRPNSTMVFDGYRVYLRPLSQEISPFDTKHSFISYIDVGRSRYQRRHELKLKWYFECECERCQDPEDDILTSVRCPNRECDEPLVTSEDAEPVMIACPKCKATADEEYVKKAQEIMKKLPSRFTVKMDVEETKKMLKEAEEYLHPINIYICRMQTAIFHITGKLEDKMPHMQKQVFENYKRCFPKMDRHNGFQLINIVRTMVESGQRKEAIPYAYDAMCIFEICFGMEHPYYLQTLALWTFLDKEISKTDQELQQLMSFDDNRLVNIGAYLGSQSVPGLDQLPPPQSVQ